MNKVVKIIWWYLKIALGCCLFGAGFSLFLNPNGANAGGLSGLAMIFVHLTGVGSVGTLTALVNIPLMIIGGLKVNKKFLVGSVVGAIFLSASIDLFSLIPAPQVEPLIGVVYGSILGGVGLGMVFSSGASTGGSDIIVRLLKMRHRNFSIGAINTIFDMTVVVLTGLTFGDVSKALYSGIAVFLCGQVVDSVVYRFDYSKVAFIISPKHTEIVKAIAEKLDRGATFLYGEGAYSGNETKVVLTIVKRQQLAQLKETVVAVDPDAFIIVQEAHQVLGEGFARYSHDSL